MKAGADCLWCHEHFEYIRLTKPRRTCSGACEMKRKAWLQRERRRRLFREQRERRSGTLNAPASLTDDKTIIQ